MSKNEHQSCIFFMEPDINSNKKPSQTNVPEKGNAPKKRRRYVLTVTVSKHFNYFRKLILYLQTFVIGYYRFLINLPRYFTFAIVQLIGQTSLEGFTHLVQLWGMTVSESCYRSMLSTVQVSDAYSVDIMGMSDKVFHTLPPTMLTPRGAPGRLLRVTRLGGPHLWVEPPSRLLSRVAVFTVIAGTWLQET